MGRQVRGALPAGHLDRPAADLQGLPPGGPRSRRRAYAHGATGKGNDQCRFQLAAEALDPTIRVVAPWRLEKFRQQFPGRSEMIAYCQEKNIPVKASVSKPYSSDENCLHISYEAGKLEDLAVSGVELVEFGMTRSPQDAPDNRKRSAWASRRACR